MENGATLLPEFDAEAANTRRMFAAIPDEKLDFRPHEKSWPLLQLAAHVANMPNWIGSTFATDELDLAAGFEQPDPKNMADIVAIFDDAVAKGRAELEGATSEVMTADWTLRTEDEVHLKMPKGVVLRSFVFNHIVHHRAQISVYLRLLDIPVPGMYGPSADETT
jgi:uncharacterized damage-inducible protein DinB